MASQINTETGISLCPPERTIKAILIIILPWGTQVGITPGLVLMAVISSAQKKSDPDKFISAKSRGNVDAEADKMR